MAVRQILKLGNPNLRLKAKTYSSKLIGSTVFLQIVSDLRDSLRESGGIGLAAPQINIPFRILVVEITNTQLDMGRYSRFPSKFMSIQLYLSSMIKSRDSGKDAYQFQE